MATLVPVDHDPFEGIRFVPVDHDPFDRSDPLATPQAGRTPGDAAPTEPDKGYHRYEFSIPLCLGCSPAQAFDRVRSFSAPGAGYAPDGTREVTLTGNNPISQTV